MLHDQTHNALPTDRTGAAFPALVVTIREGHRLAIIANQLPFADHTAVQIA